MDDDPREIADYLIDQHGLEGARRRSLDGILEAQESGDNYSLSVWREVRRVLKQRETAD